MNDVAGSPPIITNRRVEFCEDWQKAIAQRRPNGTTAYAWVGDWPRAGYWRVKYPDGKASFKPVHIVAIQPDDEDGNPVGDEKFDAFVSGAKVPYPRVWPYCGKYPISKAEYDEMMAPMLTADLSREPRPMEATADAPEINLYWSDGRAHIAMALIKAQEAIPTITKGHTAKVESTKGAASSYEYEYADIADLLDGGVRKAVAEAGIAIIHQPIISPGKFKLVTTLVHGESGEWIAGEICIAVSDARPQTYGSLISYYRRYNMVAMLNIAVMDDDDDGSDAQDDKEKKVTTSKKEEPSAAEAAMRFARKLATRMDAATSYSMVKDLLDEPETAERVKRLKEAYPEAHKVIMTAHDRNASLATVK